MNETTRYTLTADTDGEIIQISFDLPMGHSWNQIMAKAGTFCEACGFYIDRSATLDEIFNEAANGSY